MTLQPTGQLAKPVRSAVLAAGILSLAVPAVAHSQAGAKILTDTTCFRGKPLPACNTFMLLEFETRWRWITDHRSPSSSEIPEDGGNITSITIGAMRNLRNRTAIGGALELGHGEYPRDRLAVELRGRKWLTNFIAIDAAAGPLLIHTDDGAQGGGVGFGMTSHAGFVLGDLMTLTTGLDVVHSERTQTTATLGIRGGSWVGVIPCTASVLFAAWLFVLRGGR